MPDSLARLDTQIGSIEMQLSRLYAARSQLDKLSRPPKADRGRRHGSIDDDVPADHCSFPPSANLTGWKGEDVRLPVPWCEASSTHPPTQSLHELATASSHLREVVQADAQQRVRQATLDDHDRPTRGTKHGVAKRLPAAAVPVLPSLLVPCCAHSGTTFLWRCMQYAFHPQRVCGGLNPTSPHNPRYAGSHADWTAQRCPGKQYLLPGLIGNIEGHFDYRKEWFFYGGGAAAWGKGWQDYTGVDLPLCYWEPEFQRQLRERPLDDTLAQARRLCLERITEPQAEPLAVGTEGAPSFGSALRASAAMAAEAAANAAASAAVDTAAAAATTAAANSTASEALLLAAAAAAATVKPPQPRTCLHRACIPLDLHKVRLSPAYKDEYHKETMPRWHFQATKALPRVVPREHPGAIVSDMTPNYLCAPKALRNLAGSIGAPAHFRLMLLVRNPLSMLAASYKMFVRWGWVRSANLEKDVTTQLSALKLCNGTLYDQPELLRKLPPDEMLAYFGKCWRGTWHDHVTNILPFVCVSSWLAAGFQPHQFMLVRQEKLKSLPATTLLPTIANFTGLHYNEALLQDRNEEFRVHCESPDVHAAAAPTASAGSSPSGGAGRGHRRRQNQAAVDRPLVNSHSQYTGHNAVERTKLSPSVQAELDRLADAHSSMLNGLGLREL